MMTATDARFLAVLVVAAAAVLPRPARAQSAEAEALFQEGRRLMTRGDTAQACDKFEASDRVEPASGTELNLARCRETSGQLASAWAAYLRTAATARHAGNARREAEARRKAAALAPRLIYLTIAVPDDTRVDGLVIKRNDTAVEEAAWNQRVPVDPAEYTISGEAPGFRPWSTSVVVKTRSKTVEVPALEKLPEVRREPPREPPRTAGADDAAPSGARDRDAGDTEARAAPSRWTGARKLSLALAAVGAVAGGAGIALGLHVNSLENQSDATCKTTSCSDPHAVDLNHSARRYALAANVGFAVGGAAVIGAAALWFLGAPPVRGGVAILPALEPGRVGLRFARSF